MFIENVNYLASIIFIPVIYLRRKRQSFVADFVCSSAFICI